MKFSLACLSGLLLGSTALATPSAHDLRARFTRNRSMKQNIQHSKSSTQERSHFNSSNWSGAVYINPPSGGTFVGVNGTITIPEIKLPANAEPNVPYVGSVWVGIDGFYGTESILQTGIAWGTEIINNETQSLYWAWYEWYPNIMQYFELTVSPGDTVEMAVYSTSNSTGWALVNDITTGEVDFIELEAPQNYTFSAALQGANAEWIMEDFSTGDGQLYPFADFVNVTFTDCSTTLAGGKVLGLDEADIIDININNKTKLITQTEISSDSEFVVTYNA